MLGSHYWLVMPTNIFQSSSKFSYEERESECERELEVFLGLECFQMVKFVG